MHTTPPPQNARRFNRRSRRLFAALLAHQITVREWLDLLALERRLLRTPSLADQVADALRGLADDIID